MNLNDDPLRYPGVLGIGFKGSEGLGFLGFRVLMVLEGLLRLLGNPQSKIGGFRIKSEP